MKILLFLLLLLFETSNFFGRAQNDLFQFDNSLRHLFPYDGKSLPNLKNLDDVSSIFPCFMPHHQIRGAFKGSSQS
jgi:hypothetical protein